MQIFTATLSYTTPPRFQGNTKIDSSGSEPVVYFAQDASEKGSVSLHHENSLVRSLPLLPIEIALLLKVASPVGSCLPEEVMYVFILFLFTSLNSLTVVLALEYLKLSGNG